MFKEYIKPLLVLTVICLFFAAALAAVNSMTAPLIAAAAIERTNEEMRRILPGADSFDRIDTASITVDDESYNGTVKEVYRASDGSGIIFIAEVTGYSGIIRIICAIDPNGQIIETATLSHTETKGIGTIIEQESFLGTFRGTDSNLSGVDTVTGATISTSAFIRAINDVFIVCEVLSQ